MRGLESLRERAKNLADVLGSTRELDVFATELLAPVEQSVKKSGLPQLRLTQEAAPVLGVNILSIEARRLDDIERAFVTMRAKHVTALLLIADGLFGSNRKRIVELSAKSRLPAIYWRREFVEDGGLMAYGTSISDLYRRASVYVDRILKGAKPADLPVEQPTKFEFVINLKTAKSLDLTIPPSVLLRADQVIE